MSLKIKNTLSADNETKTRELLLGLGFEEHDVNNLISIINSKFNSKDRRKAEREKAEQERIKKEAQRVILNTLPLIKIKRCPCSKCTDILIEGTGIAICSGIYNYILQKFPTIETEGAHFADIWEHLEGQGYNDSNVPHQALSYVNTVLSSEQRKIVRDVYNWSGIRE